MCEVFEVSRSGYYAWRSRQRKEAKDQWPVDLVTMCQQQNKQTYGIRRVRHWIQRRTGKRVNVKGILRVMRKLNLLSVVRRRRPYTRYQRAVHKYPNLLNCSFDQAKPNQFWVTDITYIPISRGMLNMCAVLDLCGKAVLAWTKAGKSLEFFGKSCDNASKNLNKAGKLLSTTLTTPIVALGTAAIKSSIDFESSFTSVRKTVDATEAQFDQLAATSKRMSTEVAAGTNEINEVMAAGGQLGVATEHLSDFTRVMIDLGNSCEDLSADEAATTIAQFANIMDTSQSQFSNIGSTPTTA